MTHRDPVDSVTSIVSLVYELIRMATPNISPQDFAREHSEIWGWVLNKAERDRETIDPARIFDIHFDDVRTDPIGSIERIYRYFDIPVSTVACALWRQQVRDDPKGGHATHHYRPEDFGLTRDGIRRCAGRCYDRYLQVEAARPAAA